MKNRKFKVLVLGATGMAGHMVYNYLEKTERYIMFNTVFRTKLNNESFICDVRNSKNIVEIIESIKPDFVINCIGALIKESKENPENAVLLNSWLPHFLSHIAIIQKFKLIHISTDCVFSGKKGGYKVDDFRDADDFYGRSKALGELINDRDLTIRTSIIGPELKENGEGLLHWFLTQSSDVFGFKNAFWSGVTTLELAKQIELLINRYEPGIINLSSKDNISKFDMLLIFKDVFKKDIVINERLDVKVDKSLIPTPGLLVPSYDQMILDLYNYMQVNSHLYYKYL